VGFYSKRETKRPRWVDPESAVFRIGGLAHQLL
jgi:hypothetical protein